MDLLGEKDARKAKGAVDTVLSRQAKGGEQYEMKEGTVETLDAAGLFLREHNIPHETLEVLLDDDVAQKRLTRKVDLALMPLLCGTYLLQYIDKQTLAYGAVFDLFETTGTTQSQYSWLVSIFYFGYLASEWPCSYLAQKYPTGTVVSFFTVCWGIVLLCTAACDSFVGLAVCRFLLGVFEAVITPCFMMIVSMWYAREQQPARAGAFYCFNGFSNTLGGLLSYGIGQAKHWDVWRINFVTCGGLTVVWGIVLFFLLPNSILTAKQYTIQGKAMLIARSQKYQTGVLNKTVKWPQIRETFCDFQVWILFLYTLLNETINGGYAYFGKLIVKGFANNDSLLTTA